MSNEIQQITPFDGYGSDIVEYGAGNRAMTPAAAQMTGAAEQPQGSIVRKLHNALRGRYWIVMILGTVLGVLGGYYGWRSQTPLYRSEGIIQIQLNTKPILTQTGDNGLMPNYEEYVQSQAMMLTSRRIIGAAAKQVPWKEKGLGDDLAVQNRVAGFVTVEHPTRTELIRIYYLDRDPAVAAAVVQSIVKAYEEFTIGNTSMEDQRRLKALDDRRGLLSSSIARIDSQILEAAQKWGTTNLEALLDAKLTEESKLESKRNEAELALEVARKKSDTKQGINDLSLNQIAMVDQTLRNLINEYEAAQSEKARALASGVGSANPKVKGLDTLIEMQKTKIDQYAADWRDMQIKIANDPSLAAGGMTKMFGASEKVLLAEVDTLKKKYSELKEERTEIGRACLKIQDLQRQREEAAKDRSEVQRRMDVLTMESPMSARLRIISPGEEPITAYKDRRKMMGMAGFVGGFGMPLGLCLLIGLLDKRFRYSDEANKGISNVPLLGILPRLPDQLSDPEQAAVAAHCIHQIRIMLQVGNNPEKRRVFMITSASTGDGKTSLTMALGLSFAASGSKTLVIDCDMVGQGLTHRLKAHNVPGLLETLTMGTLRGHVRKTATKGLYILPIGDADTGHAGVLSPASMKRLLAACREHFDIVVIDTGPILGSLEASVVASEADGVIMAVARGQNQPLVEKAIKHLRAIGANIFGIVFNRAEHRDFQRSVPSASIRSTSAKPHEVRALLPESDESARFGPLARSVASCLPPSSTQSSHNGDHHG